MKNPAIKERTFVIIKPDGIQRSLVGEIIRRIERNSEENFYELKWVDLEKVSEINLLPLELKEKIIRELK